MDQAVLAAQTRTKELLQTLLELSLVSHVRGTSYDSSTGAKARESAIPTGGLDHKGDREDPFRQKTAEHFARQLERLYAGVHKCSRARAEAIRDQILTDAKTALWDWQHTPDAPGEPVHGTIQWKCRVANDPRSSRVVAGHWGTSHVTVLRLRKQYAGLRIPEDTPT